MIVLERIIGNVCGSQLAMGRGCLTRVRVRRGEANTNAQPSGETTLMQPQKNPNVPRNSRVLSFLNAPNKQIVVFIPKKG